MIELCCDTGPDLLTFRILEPFLSEDTTHDCNIVPFESMLPSLLASKI